MLYSATTFCQIKQGGPLEITLIALSSYVKVGLNQFKMKVLYRNYT